MGSASEGTESEVELDRDGSQSVQKLLRADVWILDGVPFVFEILLMPYFPYRVCIWEDLFTSEIPPHRGLHGYNSYSQMNSD